MKTLIRINEQQFLFTNADKDMGHPSRRVITKPLDQTLLHQQQQHQQAEEEYNNEGIISVYCAILGAIVLGNIKKRAKQPCRRKRL